MSPELSETAELRALRLAMQETIGHLHRQMAVLEAELLRRVAVLESEVERLSRREAA